MERGSEHRRARRLVQRERRRESTPTTRRHRARFVPECARRRPRRERRTAAHRRSRRWPARRRACRTRQVSEPVGWKLAPRTTTARVSLRRPGAARRRDGGDGGPRRVDVPQETALGPQLAPPSALTLTSAGPVARRGGAVQCSSWAIALGGHHRGRGRREVVAGAKAAEEHWRVVWAAMRRRRAEVLAHHAHQRVRRVRSQRWHERGHLRRRRVVKPASAPMERSTRARRRPTPPPPPRGDAAAGAAQTTASPLANEARTSSSPNRQRGRRRRCKILAADCDAHPAASRVARGRTEDDRRARRVDHRKLEGVARLVARRRVARERERHGSRDVGGGRGAASADRRRQRKRPSRRWRRRRSRAAATAPHCPHVG